MRIAGTTACRRQLEPGRAQADRAELGLQFGKRYDNALTDEATIASTEKDEVGMEDKYFGCSNILLMIVPIANPQHHYRK